MRLEDLAPGVVVGVVPGGDVNVVAVEWSGPDAAVVLTYRDDDRNLAEKVLLRADESKLNKVRAGQPPVRRAA